MQLERTFQRELVSLRLPARTEPSAPIAADDLAALPESARRYFAFTGAIGRPHDWSFRVGFAGEFRMAPDKSWLPCEGFQFDSSLGITRVFHMRLSMGGLLPTMVRDTYVLGRARMLGKVFDLVPVVDETGPELDLSELVTYLNDALTFAPSMLLGPSTVWTAVDDRSFDVAITDFGLTAKGRVSLDERGAMVDFSTEDRYVADPWTKGHPFVRGRWNTPIDGWTVCDGRPFPTGGRAVWHLPGGVFEYARFHFVEGTLAYDVAPRR
jgi:hypothetical protein